MRLLKIADDIVVWTKSNISYLTKLRDCRLNLQGTRCEPPRIFPARLVQSVHSWTPNKFQEKWFLTMHFCPPSQRGCSPSLGNRPPIGFPYLWSHLALWATSVVYLTLWYTGHPKERFRMVFREKNILPCLPNPRG